MGAAVTDPLPPVDSTALREQHQAMVARATSGETLSASEIAEFTGKVIAAGAYTPPGRMRDRLRQILFHWMAEVETGGSAAEVPALAPFDETMAAPAAQGAGATPGPGATTPAAMAAAPPAAPEPAPPESVIAGPQSRSAGTMSIGLDAVISPPAALALPSGSAKLETSTVLGTIVRRFQSVAKRVGGPGDAPAPAPAPAVPPAAGSDNIESHASARAIVRIGALARQWQTSPAEVRTGYLLTGRALTEASLYVDDDPDINTFVEASREQIRLSERKALRRHYIGLAAASVVAMAIVSGYFYQRQKIADEKALAQQNQRISNLIATERRTMQTETKLEAQAAIEALAQGRIDPLKTLLKRLSDASDSQLKGLEWHKNAGGTQPQVELKEPPATDRAPQKAVAVPIPGSNAGSCSGYLWFGSSGNSRIADGSDPKDLKPNSKVEIDIRSDIRLRVDPPSPSYALGPVAGTVPAGSSVAIESAPMPFVRPAGTQYWAKVTVPRQFCVNVYLQYQGNEDRKNAALAALDGIGVQTPPAESIQSAAGHWEVRYFWPEDEPIAQQISDALAPLLPARRGVTSRRLKVLPLLDFPKRPAIGTIEVWMDFGD